jgi:hypothetical protein
METHFSLECYASCRLRPEHADMASAGEELEDQAQPGEVSEGLVACFGYRRMKMLDDEYRRCILMERRPKFKDPELEEKAKEIWHDENYRPLYRE